MIPTFVVVAALAVGYEPVADVPLHKVPGPAFLIPCKVAAADLVTHVQLWVSADRGKKWDLYEEITPDKPAFTFVAKKPGEYWFAPRIKKKDGTMLPADVAELVATQRVAVATGSDSPEPLTNQTRTVADTVDELDEELTRVELELIRKDIKRLSEEKELTPEAEDKFDRLRGRLRDLRERLRSNRDPLVTGSTLETDLPGARPISPVLPPARVVPSAPASDDAHILSPVIPIPMAVSSSDEIPTYKVLGPTFHIPCKAEMLPPAVVSVELWYSINGGKTWSKSSDILLRDQTHFEFQAQKAGEYLFAPRLRYKNGLARPDNSDELVPQLRVSVQMGNGRPGKTDPDQRSPSLQVPPLPATVPDGRIPPSTVPTAPLVIPTVPMPVPARPVAPPPRVPER